MPEQEFDAAPGERPRRVLAQPRCELTLEHTLAAVYEDDAQFRERDRAIHPFACATEEVVDLGDHLGAREAAPGDDEREHLPAKFDVLFHGCLLEHVDEVVAEADRVGERLERERVLGQPRLTAKVGHGAERHDEAVVGDHRRAGQDAGAESNGARLDVDTLDLADVDPRRGEQPAKWSDGVDDAHAPGHDLSEHRLEDEVVLTVDDADLDGRTPSAQPLKLQRSVDAAEAAAEDHDPVRRCAHTVPLRPYSRTAAAAVRARLARLRNGLDGSRSLGYA